MFESHQLFVRVACSSYLILEIQLEILYKSPGRFLILCYFSSYLIIVYLDDCFCNMYFYVEMAAFIFVFMYLGGRLARIARVNSIARFSFAEYAVLVVPCALAMIIANQHLIEFVKEHYRSYFKTRNHPEPTLFGTYQKKFDQGLLFWPSEYN